MRHEIGREPLFFVHVSLSVPYLNAAGEQKTNRRSTRSPRCGPSVFSGRPSCFAAHRQVPESMTTKVALMCDVTGGRRQRGRRVDIYDIPSMLHEQGLDGYIIEHFGIEAGQVDWSGWLDLLMSYTTRSMRCRFGLVGKYVPAGRLPLGHPRRCAPLAHQTSVKIHWIPSDECATPEGAAEPGRHRCPAASASVASKARSAR